MRYILRYTKKSRSHEDCGQFCHLYEKRKENAQAYDE